MAKTKKSGKSNWKTSDNRFVAFFDILGFKDLVNRSSHKEIYEQLSKISKIKKLLEEITDDDKSDHNIEDAEVYIVSFSDSIVLFSKNDNPSNFKYFLAAVRWLFAKTIESRIPMKGGIAHGEISLNKSEQIYFGQAIIDAYLIEEDVNYFGVVAHSTVDKYIRINNNNIDLEYCDKILINIKTPLKYGIIEHKNVNWFNKLDFGENEKIEKEEKRRITENIIKDFRLNVSGSPRRYVDNTLKVLEEIKKTTHNNVYKK